MTPVSEEPTENLGPTRVLENGLVGFIQGSGLRVGYVVQGLCVSLLITTSSLSSPSL